MENDNFRYVVCTQFYEAKYKYMEIIPPNKCLDMTEENGESFGELEDFEEGKQ